MSRMEGPLSISEAPSRTVQYARPPGARDTPGFAKDGILRPFHAFLFAIVLVAGCASEGVSPGSKDDYFRSGETERFTLRVDLSKAAPSLEPLDVLLLFDSTGSMGNIINEVRENAEDIMRSVHGIYSNSAFGVAGLYDYDTKHDPFILYQDITPEMEAISTALFRLSPLGGKDWPEAYTRALHESRFISWRPESRRYIVLFGDAPAHDPSFYGTDYGIDPGRDRRKGTPDDLYLKDVVAQLAQDGISVITVYDRGPWYHRKPNMDDAVKGFNYMAAQTKGMSIPVGSSGDVPDAIKAGVRGTRRAPPAVFVPAAVREWVDIDPARSKDESHRHFAFRSRIHPPRGTPAGVYRFPLIAMHGGKIAGGEIGRTWVTVRIGVAGINWRFVILFFPLLALLIYALWRRINRGQSADRYMENGLWATLLLKVSLFLLLILVVPLLARKFVPEPPVRTIAERSADDLIAAGSNLSKR